MTPFEAMPWGAQGHCLLSLFPSNASTWLPHSLWCLAGPCTFYSCSYLFWVLLQEPLLNAQQAAVNGDFDYVGFEASGNNGEWNKYKSIPVVECVVITKDVFQRTSDLRYCLCVLGMRARTLDLRYYLRMLGMRAARLALGLCLHSLWLFLCHYFRFTVFFVLAKRSQKQLLGCY